MKQTLGLLIVLGFAVSLYAADPIEGTWKLNLAKSKFAAADPAPKSAVLTGHQQGDTLYFTQKGIAADGTPISNAYTVPVNGGPFKYTEGGAPGGATITSKPSAGNSVVDFTVTSKDGKVVGTGRLVVSPDHKSFRNTTNGTDPQGKPFESVGAFEKQ